VLALAGLFQVAGCSDDSVGKVCQQGETKACKCAGGASGTSDCASDGMSWRKCVCTATDGGSDGAVDAATGDGVKPKDSAGGDGVKPKDSAGGEAGADGALKDIGPADASMAKYPWSVMPTPKKSESLYDVWGTGAKNVYVVGQKGNIMRYTGRKSQTQAWWTPVTSGTSSSLHGLWGSSRFDIFALGEKGTIVHFDGSKWASQTSGFTRTFRAVHGSGHASVYAMGEFGTLAHNTRATYPNTWTTVKAGMQETFLGGWGTGAKNFYLAGSNGTIIKYNGTSWTKMTSGTSEHLWDIWGASNNAIFAVGEKGVILRYNGKAWKKMTVPISTQLFGVWGSGPTDVWAVGDYGETLHFNGTSWSKKVSGVKVALYAVWGTGSDNIFAVGESNTILQYAPCGCKVGTRCYRSGEFDDTGCKVCNPSVSKTSLTSKPGACTIAGKCYAQGEKDSTHCSVCAPLKSTTSWTPAGNVCSVGGVCYPSGMKGPASCQVCAPAKNKSGWSQTTNSCLIGGKCYAAGAKDTSGCQQCAPAKSTTGWTPLTGMCLIGGKCYKNGTKDTAISCRSCNTAKNSKNWTVDPKTCLVGGKCIKDGVKDTSGCQICNSAKTSTAWSAVAGKCYISAKCYNAGAGDGSGCRTCAPGKNDKDWTIGGGYCYVGAKCYNNGGMATNGCQKCVTAKSQTSLTTVANKCWIANKCYNKGQVSAGGCDICDPTQSTTTWTKVGCTAYPLPKKKITFATGSSTSNMTMYTINSDGTNLTKVPGFGTVALNYSTYMYGRPRQYYQFTADVPQYASKYSYYPVLLPHGKGGLRWYRDVTANKVGLLHYAADGTVKSLYSTPGSSTSYFYYYIAVSDNGTFVAGVSSTYKRLILMRTDGKTFSNGKSYVEWSLSPAYYVLTNGITVTDKGVFLVTRPTSSSYKYNLWWAPTTGTQAPKVVNFPTSGGANPYYIYPYAAGSRDGSKVAFNIGPTSSSSSLRDIVVVDAATGKATRITKSTGYHYYPSTSWGYGTSSHYVDVSAKGSYVAYVKYNSSYNYSLYVAKTDGTGTPIEVSATSNFNSNKRFYSVRWATDDILTFTAYGSSSSYMDIFSYQVSTNTVRNLSKQQDSTKPFSLNSQTYHRIYGTWFSPNKKYVYYISYKNSPTSRDIKGNNMATGTKFDITTGAEVYTSSDAFASCGKGSKMFFAAEPKYVSYTYLQVHMFDMNKPAKAVQLTNLTNKNSSTYNYIYDMTANEDCSFVAFRAGYSYYDAYSVQATTPPMVGQMTQNNSSSQTRYVYDYMGYSEDKSQVIYFAGYASNRYEMYVAPPAMGSCCQPKKVYAGSGTYKYWMYFGTN